MTSKQRCWQWGKGPPEPCGTLNKSRADRVYLSQTCKRGKVARDIDPFPSAHFPVAPSVPGSPGRRLWGGNHAGLNLGVGSRDLSWRHLVRAAGSVNRVWQVLAMALCPSDRKAGDTGWGHRLVAGPRGVAPCQAAIHTCALPTPAPRDEVSQAMLWGARPEHPLQDGHALHLPVPGEALLCSQRAALWSRHLICPFLSPHPTMLSPYSTSSHVTW